MRKLSRGQRFRLWLGRRVQRLGFRIAPTLGDLAEALHLPEIPPGFRYQNPSGTLLVFHDPPEPGDDWREAPTLRVQVAQYPHLGTAKLTAEDAVLLSAVLYQWGGPKFVRGLSPWQRHDLAVIAGEGPAVGSRVFHSIVGGRQYL